MKIVLVYLPDAPVEGGPVAAFPGERTSGLEQQVAEFVEQCHPGR